MDIRQNLLKRNYSSKKYVKIFETIRDNIKIKNFDRILMLETETIRNLIVDIHFDFNRAQRSNLLNVIPEIFKE